MYNCEHTVLGVWMLKGAVWILPRDKKDLLFNDHMCVRSTTCFFMQNSIVDQLLCTNSVALESRVPYHKYITICYRCSDMVSLVCYYFSLSFQLVKSDAREFVDEDVVTILGFLRALRGLNKRKAMPPRKPKTLFTHSVCAAYG